MKEERYLFEIRGLLSDLQPPEVPFPPNITRFADQLEKIPISKIAEIASRLTSVLSLSESVNRAYLLLEAAAALFFELDEGKDSPRRSPKRSQFHFVLKRTPIESLAICAAGLDHNLSATEAILNAYALFDISAHALMGIVDSKSFEAGITGFEFNKSQLEQGQWRRIEEVPIPEYFRLDADGNPMSVDFVKGLKRLFPRETHKDRREDLFTAFVKDYYQISSLLEESPMAEFKKGIPYDFYRVAEYNMEGWRKWRRSITNAQNRAAGVLKKPATVQ
jgi:hypothetical protein